MKKWQIILGAILLLILFVLIFWRGRATQPSNASVRFEGFTPLTNGAAALFIFTNGTRHSVHFRVAAIEYRTSNGWATLPQTTANTLVGALRRGTGFSWAVQVPDTNTAWRIRLSCVEHATGIRGGVDKVIETVDRFRTGNPTEIFAGRNYEVVGSETSN